MNNTSTREFAQRHVYKFDASLLTAIKKYRNDCIKWYVMEEAKRVAIPQRRKS